MQGKSMLGDGGDELLCPVEFDSLWHICWTGALTLAMGLAKGGDAKWDWQVERE